MMPGQVRPDDGQHDGEDRGRFEPIQAAREKIYGDHSGRNRFELYRVAELGFADTDRRAHGSA
jgi:hypothetical protein